MVGLHFMNLIKTNYSIYNLEIQVRVAAQIKYVI